MASRSTFRQLTLQKKFKLGLFYFPRDNSLEQARTSQVIQGQVETGQMVRVNWNKEHLDLPAKIMALSDDKETLELKRTELCNQDGLVTVKLSNKDLQFVEECRKEGLEPTCSASSPVKKRGHSGDTGDGSKKKTTKRRHQRNEATVQLLMPPEPPLQTRPAQPIITQTQLNPVLSCSNTNSTNSLVSSPAPPLQTRPAPPIITQAQLNPALSCNTDSLISSQMPPLQSTPALPIITQTQLNPVLSRSNTDSPMSSPMPSLEITPAQPIITQTQLIQTLSYSNTDSLMSSPTQNLEITPAQPIITPTQLNPMLGYSNVNSRMAQPVTLESNSNSHFTNKRLSSTGDFVDLTSDNHVLSASSFPPVEPLAPSLNSNSDFFSADSDNASYDRQPNISNQLAFSTNNHASFPHQHNSLPGRQEYTWLPSSMSRHSSFAREVTISQPDLNDMKQKITLVLSNQKVIIYQLQQLQAFVLGNNVTVSSGNEEGLNVAFSDASGTNTPLIELSLEELRELERTRSKKTTEAYLAVLILEKLTTLEDRKGRTVYGLRGSKKPLNSDVVERIKLYFHLIHPKACWSLAVDAMNNKLKKNQLMA